MKILVIFLVIVYAIPRLKFTNNSVLSPFQDIIFGLNLYLFSLTMQNHPLLSWEWFILDIISQKPKFQWVNIFTIASVWANNVSSDSVTNGQGCVFLLSCSHTGLGGCGESVVFILHRMSCSPWVHIYVLFHSDDDDWLAQFIILFANVTTLKNSTNTETQYVQFPLYLIVLFHCI